MVRRSFLSGFILCLLLCACAGFSYRYYGLDGVSYDRGKLLGPKAKDDLPFSDCAPDAASKHKCVVMFVSEFFAMRQDYEDTKQKLKECQKPSN